MNYKYPRGATWEARTKKRLYKILFEEFYPFGRMFFISITKIDGSPLPGHYWENNDKYGAISMAMKFCRRAYFEEIKSKRVI